MNESTVSETGWRPPLSWQDVAARLPQVRWGIYTRFHVCPVDQEPFDMETLIDSMEMSIDGQGIPREVWGEPTGFAIRDVSGGSHLELRCDPQKRADKPEEDLVSPAEAYALLTLACRLLSDTREEFGRIQAVQRAASDRIAAITSGITDFYGDEAHVPVGLARLLEDDDSDW